MLQQVLGEVGGGLYQPSVVGAPQQRLHIREHIKRATRTPAADSGDATQPFHHPLAAGVKTLARLLHPVAVVLQGSQRRILRHRAGVGGHLILQRLNRAGDFGRRAEIANPPPRHRETFGDPINCDGLVPHLFAERADALVRMPVVHQLLIDLVGDNPEPMRERQRGNLLEGLARVDRACWVARRVENNRLRARRNGSAQGVVGRQKVMALVRRHEHGHTAHQAHLLWIRDPARRRDNHLVAGVYQCHQRIEDGVLRAAGDHNLAGVVAELVFAPELRADGFPQGHNTGRGRVFRVARVDSGNRARFGELRRIKVGFARGEAQHIDPLLAHRLGTGSQCQRRRRLHRARPFRKHAIRGMRRHRSPSLHSRSRFTSSTSIVSRRRKMTVIMPSPTATSAAATPSTNSAKMCPATCS
ncbi:hypothetical protein HRbin14_01880 [bacterium HR14]|nr:hypothetical protein HRbin14_01880 [bacterium HR14]